jgi:hypothetical protein
MIPHLLIKIRSKIWNKIIQFTRDWNIYIYLYKSFWYSLSFNELSKQNHINYYTARPNLGAGIGHQMANWIAGYWFAKQFGLNYAHSPFSSKKWEDFLGFHINEVKVAVLIKNGYKKVLLPLFDEYNTHEVEIQKKIIESYNHTKVVFIAEQDQFYKDQFGVADILKNKFFSSPSRNNDRLIYDPKLMNIAIHIRRGDIVIGQHNKNPNLLLRWQENDYFVNVLRNVLANLKTEKPIAIYLFSQGEIDDFVEFNQFDNLQFCLDLSPIDSFLYMVYADILITSKSSFSYKPALLNNGLKVCPKDFWHGYPQTNDWVMAEESGELLNKISFTINE